MVKVKIQIRRNDIPSLPGRARRGMAAGLRRSVTETVQRGRDRTPVETGELRDSWRSTIGETHAEFGPTAAHAEPLEFGTSRMAGQPFVRPAIAEMTGRYPEIFEAEVRRALSG